MKATTVLLPAMAIIASLSACAREPSNNDDTRVVAELPAAPVQDSQSRPAPGMLQPLPIALVHKSPTCGCCGLWVDHLKHAGFTVDVREEANINPVKERLGVPDGKGSCHTAEIGGYVIEGHVPADDIKRLLRERPRARGLVLPGMPVGSPGMEVPDGTVQPYTVELVRLDGTTAPYATHGP